jgi:nucleotidyltransferase/DNA polymerase involved in DNA repair
MDAFFAAIEQREHPELQGKAVIVGADPRKGQGRGVVSTCSYEARKFGVHSAMPISQAYKLCPHGVYVPPNGSLYSQVSKEIFKIFYNFTDLVEPLSIDEAFLDITGSINLFETSEAIGRLLKTQIYKEQKLTASVGIAPNKFLAKIASDLEKPDGLVRVDPDKITQFLDPLDISKMWGAGRKTLEHLHKFGIHKFSDLAQFPLTILEQTFGKLGKHFFLLARGIDDRPVISEHEVKSVSNEITFGRDVKDTDYLLKTLFRLSEKVAYRLRKKNLKGKTIHLKLRYQGFETITRNRTISYLTANTEKIYHEVQDLFDNNYIQSKKVRLLGVGVSGFVDEIGHQLSLFEKQIDESSELDMLEDLVREKFGKQSITRAESLGKGKERNNGRNW